jgi:hypothetical protein
MHRYYSYDLVPALWDELLKQLFENGRLFSHQFVLDEIEPTDQLGRWVSDKKPSFFSATERQTELVTQILARFPGLIDYNKEIDEADPWVIALAIEKTESSNLLEDYSRVTVVSTESKRSSKRIPAVCQAFGVSHMDLKEFFADNGWKLRIEVSG